MPPGRAPCHSPSVRLKDKRIDAEEPVDHRPGPDLERRVQGPVRMETSEAKPALVTDFLEGTSNQNFAVRLYRKGVDPARVAGLCRKRTNSRGSFGGVSTPSPARVPT